MKFLARALAGSALLAAAPAAANQPVVTDIHWPYIDSYCTFWRKDHSFNFNDETTTRPPTRPPTAHCSPPMLKCPSDEAGASP